MLVGSKAMCALNFTIAVALEIKLTLEIIVGTSEAYFSAYSRLRRAACHCRSDQKEHTGQDIVQGPFVSTGNN